LNPLEVAILHASNNPNDTNSDFKLSIVPNSGNTAINWYGVSGLTYGIKYSTTLGNGSWSTIATGLSGSDGIETWLDTDPGRLGVNRGYYRVVVE